MATSAATEGRPKRTRKRATGTGRPHDLDRPIPQADGTTIPAWQAVIDQMLIGLPITEASLAVGLSRGTAHHWRGEGAAVTAALADGTLQPSRLTDYQRKVAAFFDAATQAEAEAIARNAQRLDVLAAGGFVTERVVTEYDAEGKVTARRVTTATQPPDTKAVTFWLERRAVQLYGKAVRVEHAAGADGPLVQTESPLAKLTEALEAIERRREQGRAQLAVIETTAEEAEAS